MDDSINDFSEENSDISSAIDLRYTSFEEISAFFMEGRCVMEFFVAIRSLGFALFAPILFDSLSMSCSFLRLLRSVSISS